jgi:hypothetical protein
VHSLVMLSLLSLAELRMLLCARMPFPVTAKSDGKRLDFSFFVLAVVKNHTFPRARFRVCY